MIACLLYKRVIARSIDANQALPASAQRHIRDCPACRQFYALEHEITRRLVAEAELRHQHSPPPFLRARIMASLDRQPQPAGSNRRFLHPIWAAALLMLGLGLLSIPIMQTRQNSTRQIGPGSSANSTTLIQQLANNTSTGTNVFEWSKALDQPLETEMQSVVSDAKTAIQLLAQNFLPERSFNLPSGRGRQ